MAQTQLWIFIYIYKRVEIRVFQVITEVFGEISWILGATIFSVVFEKGGV